MSSFVPKQGEVYLVNFESQVGSEYTKVRPAVVVGVLGAGRVVPIVPLTTHEGKGRILNVQYGYEVVLAWHKEPELRSRAVCTQIATFDKARFLRPEPLTTLSKADLELVLDGVARVLGLKPALRPSG
jgi:mRNA-degrading endonuclease toxin of MazEF toxin-antitoxin module